MTPLNPLVASVMNSPARLGMWKGGVSKKKTTSDLTIEIVMACVYISYHIIS